MIMEMLGEERFKGMRRRNAKATRKRGALGDNEIFHDETATSHR
jgi:hypothetical protein